MNNTYNYSYNLFFTGLTQYKTLPAAFGYVSNVGLTIGH